MSKEEKIKALTALWYKCLVDHHKDRDCHFVIEMKFSYGGESSIEVWHYGYVAKDWNIKVGNLSEAQDELIRRISYQIMKEAKGWMEEEENYMPNVDKSYWKEILDELKVILNE